jgi:hypothetical protein
MTFILKDREFTNSLNDPNSDDYQTLARQLINNVSFTILMEWIYKRVLMGYIMSRDSLNFGPSVAKTLKIYREA